MSYVVLWKCRSEVTGGCEDPEFNAGVLPTICQTKEEALKVALEDLETVKREIIENWAYDEFENSDFFDENATEDEENDNLQNFLEKFDDEEFDVYSRPIDQINEVSNYSDELCSLDFRTDIENISWHLVEVK